MKPQRPIGRPQRWPLVLACLVTLAVLSPISCHYYHARSCAPDYVGAFHGLRSVNAYEPMGDDCQGIVTTAPVAWPQYRQASQ